MSKTQNIKWAYIYTEGCGPCQRITPIIDTMISMGNTNIYKVDWRTLDNQSPLRRFGTPHIVLFNLDTNEFAGKHYSGTFWTGYFDLYVNHKEMLSIDIPPVDFMVKLLSQTKDLDLNMFK